MSTLGRLLEAAIVLFWLVMSGLLVEREILPGLRQEQDPSYEALLAHRLTAEDTHTGIFVFGHRIGEAHTTIRPEVDGTYCITSFTKIHAGTPGPGSVVPEGLTIQSTSLVDFRYRLKKTTVSIVSGDGGKATIRGIVDNDELDLVTDLGGQEGPRHERVPYPGHGTASNGLSPFISMPNLTVGKEWDIESINPLTQQVQKTRARVTELEEIRWNDRRVECFLVTARVGPGEAKAWIDKAGRILREEPFPGLVMIREEK